MKAIEILQQYWAQVERLATYAQYCAGQDVKAIVCRDFWLWTVYIAVGLGLLIVFVVGKKAVSEQLEFRRNRKRLDARKIAADADEQAMWPADVTPDIELSQDELAAALRQGIKARAEAGPDAADQRAARKSKTSPMRELGTVMRDLATTIKEAASARALVPAAPAPAGAGERRNRSSAAARARDHHAYRHGGLQRLDGAR